MSTCDQNLYLLMIRKFRVIGKEGIRFRGISLLDNGSNAPDVVYDVGGPRANAAVAGGLPSVSCTKRAIGEVLDHALPRTLMFVQARSEVHTQRDSDCSHLGRENAFNHEVLRSSRRDFEPRLPATSGETAVLRSWRYQPATTAFRVDSSVLGRTRSSSVAC